MANGFRPGIDSLDITLDDPNGYRIANVPDGGTVVGVSITGKDGSGNATGTGAFLAGLTASDLSGHASTYATPGYAHLLIH